MPKTGAKDSLFRRLDRNGLGSGEEREHPPRDGQHTKQSSDGRIERSVCITASSSPSVAIAARPSSRKKDLPQHFDCYGGQIDKIDHPFWQTLSRDRAICKKGKGRKYEIQYKCIRRTIPIDDNMDQKPFEKEPNSI